MARKFLYFVAFCAMLAVAAVVALKYYGRELATIGLVPKEAFEPQRPLAGNAYADPAMWFVRPGHGGDAARFLPTGFDPKAAGEAGPLEVAVFFVHPTSYLNRAHWNAALDDAESQTRARLFIRGMASPFNRAAELWIPRYRQATFGAFLTDDPRAGQAIAAAYADVAKAFDYFVASVPADTPIVLAGHSQGALHLTRLLRERIAGTPLAKRVVAAYVIGWPISKTADLPRLGLPECATADQAGCILSWQSFGEPADPSGILDTFDATHGFTGAPRKGTAMVCTNPITGTRGAAAPATANLGTLVPSADLASATLEPGQIPARCDGRGLLLIGAPPNLGNYVLPGNNYHVYDYSLFWANVRADAARRLAAFKAMNAPKAAE